MTAVRAIIVLAVSAALWVLVVPSMFVNPPWPYFGLSISPQTQNWQSVIVDVAPGSPGERAGIRSGDAIGCLSFRDEAKLFPSYTPHLAFTPVPVSLCVRHAGVWHPVTVDPKKMPPPGLLYRTPFVAALRAAVFTLFLFVGCALVMARPSLLTWLLFAYCAGNLPSAAAQGMLLWLPPATYAAAMLCAYIITPASGLLALFTLTVPEHTPPRGWRRAAFVIVAVVTALTTAYTLWSGLATTTWMPAIGEWLDLGLAALTVLFVIARLVTMERDERARFGWAAFAIIFGIACNSMRNYLVGDVSNAAGVLTCFMPICLMYAIVRRHVIDVRFVISRTVVYGVITTLVVGVIGLVDWATSAYLTQVRVALAIDAAVTILLGVALHRGYRWIEHGVDLILFRKKHEAEAYLRRLARTLFRADREETIDEALVVDPCEKLDLAMAALFRVQPQGYVPVLTAGWDSRGGGEMERDSALVRFLTTERSRVAIRDLRKHVEARFADGGAPPTIAIPIFRGDELIAFSVYGLHRDGSQLDPDEVDVLDRLNETAAQAYMRIENVRYHAMMQNPLPA